MNKSVIKDKIDFRIYDRITSKITIDKYIPSLTYNRFDLAFKLMYIEGLTSKKSLDYIQVYDQHIRAFSLGSYTEPGQEGDKNSLEKYKEIFETLYLDIKNEGFDSEKSLVPVALDGSILNGAHRASISVFLNGEMGVVKTGLKASVYDYKFFKKRNIRDSVLDKAASKFIEYSDNTYVAFVWPTARGYNIDLQTLFPNIVYRKDLKLNSNGAHNLLSQIYRGESWLGTVDDNFKGVVNKLVKCFRTYEPIRIIAFQEESLEKVVQIKEKIRSVFGVGKHSIHITDTHEEAMSVSKLVFNDNGVHFLNHAKPNKYINMHEKLNKFKKFLDINDECYLDYILDADSTFELYGLKLESNINYISCSSKDRLVLIDGVNDKSCDINYYNQDLVNLIYDSNNFFYFEGLKFVSFKEVYKFKKKRSFHSDVSDCDLMDSLFENNKWNRWMNSLKHDLIYKKILLYHYILLSLKKIYVYEFLKRIHKFLR